MHFVGKLTNARNVELRLNRFEKRNVPCFCVLLQCGLDIMHERTLINMMKYLL